jgi:curli biogenesis system outer membrane secretion channel CsgG
LKEFEEKLVKSGCYAVLERRDFAAIAAQEQNNKSIESVSQMTPKIRQELELIKAQMVIFGKLSHGAAGGNIE